MKKRLYAKVVFAREGVIMERKYETEAEADAFVEGFDSAMLVLDVEDDDHYATTDTDPAEDE